MSHYDDLDDHDIDPVYNPIQLERVPFSRFPDGHVHFEKPSDRVSLNEFNHRATRVIAGIQTGDYLLLLAQLKEAYPALTDLEITYMSASRSDRAFRPGEANDLRINCRIINSMKFERVRVLRPHSPAMLALLDNAKENDVTPWLVREVTAGKKDCTIVIPDAGASSWVPKVLEGRDYPMIQALKKRTEKDGVRSLSAKLCDPVFPDHNYIIVDDICDGGATFIAISKALQDAKVPVSNIALCVTHGIFSKGFDELMANFSKIAVTNSIPAYWNTTPPNNLIVCKVR
jgi:ribose-phosphate pyrophosphokinase